jgi:hypothetical protein
MKLIYPNEYSDLRSELNEFVILCKSQNYRPVKEDFNEVIKFLLLNHTAVGHMCESFEANPNSIVNHLFESFNDDIESIEELDEYTAFKGDSSYDNKKDFDTATGLVKTGAVVAGGAAIAGAVATGMYVQYLFKKGKVKKLVQKELDAELQKLSQYQKLSQMKQKLGDMKGEKVGSVDFPGMASGPTLEPVPEPKSN